MEVTIVLKCMRYMRKQCVHSCNGVTWLGRTYSWPLNTILARDLRPMFSRNQPTGMTLNCIHIFIVTGSFLYWCVMRPASQRFFIHSCIYLRILIISYLATFLGISSLSMLMCRKAVNQSINPINQSSKYIFNFSLVSATRQINNWRTIAWASRTKLSLKRGMWSFSEFLPVITPRSYILVCSLILTHRQVLHRCFHKLVCLHYKAW